MKPSNNIVLTGFMGTGKSTIGKIVAEQLCREFCDMDTLIEARCGMSIPDIFRSKGEHAFRAIEREVAEELSAQSRLVIATGGGALVGAEMRQLMSESGTVICLNASPDEIRARLAETDNRPLAVNWQQLLQERRTAYAQIANQVETTGKDPETIAREIVSLCGRSLHVRTPEGQGYYIWINPGALREIEMHLDTVGLNDHVVVVTNDCVAPLHGERLVRRLPRASMIVAPDGEGHKNLDTVRDVYDRMLAVGADRNTVLVALGGGVVGDMAGYVAATYMRGIRLVQMPTTLLSMVDSSVGGKVGVDLPQGKNLIGAFKQPQMVVIDTNVLDTLPDLQWRCGMAEVIKHGLISQPALLDPEMWNRENLADLLLHAVRVKVKVVEQDPYEKGIRAHLNLGHTFGHAIEKVTEFAVPHGEAVAIGICKAAQLSRNLGLIDDDLVKRIMCIFERIGLPVDINLDRETWYAAMSTDKKWQAGKSRFVLLKALGEATIVDGLPKDDVLAVL